MTINYNGGIGPFRLTQTRKLRIWILTFSAKSVLFYSQN